MAEATFWDKAGDALFNGIGKYVDAETRTPPVLNNPTEVQNTKQGTVQAGVPTNYGILGNSAAPYVIAGGIALVAVLIFALKK